MSWLSVFKSVLHAAEAAAQIAAPFVATVDPTIGSLMLQATNAAVGVEAIMVNAPGADKAAVVKQGTQATVDVINGLLVSQGKKPLPTTTTDSVQQVVKVVVTGLKSVATAVAVATPATPGPAPVTLSGNIISGSHNFGPIGGGPAIVIKPAS